MVFTDAIHDVVLSHNWQPISTETNLQGWLIPLKDEVYDFDGNAYDNGAVMLVRLD